MRWKIVRCHDSGQFGDRKGWLITDLKKSFESMDGQEAQWLCDVLNEQAKTIEQEKAKHGYEDHDNRVDTGAVFGPVK